MLHRMIVLAVLGLSSASAWAHQTGDASDVQNAQAESLYTALAAAGASTFAIKDSAVDSYERDANRVSCTQTLIRKKVDSRDRVFISSLCTIKTGKRILDVTLSPALSDLLFRALANAEVDLKISADGTQRKITTQGVSCRSQVEWTAEREFLTQPTALTENFSCTVRL